MELWKCKDERDEIPTQTSTITNYLRASLTAPKSLLTVKSMDQQWIYGSVWKRNLDREKNDIFTFTNL